MQNNHITPLLQLHILTGNFEDILFPIKAPGKYRIGRDPKCEVRIDDQDVSRVHAQLLWNGEIVTIEDLRSTNGIFLNGEKIICKKLVNGDIVAFGSSVFRIEIQDDIQRAVI
ncbi:MAG: FHA domain-containing protein [Fibrobacterota bacterium]